MVTHQRIAYVRISAFLVIAAVISQIDPQEVIVVMRIIYPLAAASAFCLAGVLVYRYWHVRDEPLAILYAETAFYAGASLVLLHMGDINITRSYVVATRVLLAGVLAHACFYAAWRTFRVHT